VLSELLTELLGFKPSGRLAGATIWSWPNGGWSNNFTLKLHSLS
jgi:hypothetical protein